MALSNKKIKDLYHEAVSKARSVILSLTATEDEIQIAKETLAALHDAEIERIEASVAMKASVLKMLTVRLNGLSAALQTGVLEEAASALAGIAAKYRDELIEMGEDVRVTVSAAIPPVSTAPKPPSLPKKNKRLLPKNLRLSDTGLELIRHFEGFENEAYQDSVGVWTIGYGHTKNVQSGMVVSHDEALHLLRGDVQDSEKAVQKRVTVKLLPQEFDALVSWTFNLGAGNLKVSTLLRKLNEKDYEAVPAEIRRWNKAGGEVMDGLIRRRGAEAALWSTGKLDFG